MVARDYFQSFNLFSEEEIDAFLQLFEIRRVNKNEYFIQEGERCKEVAFIASGIFRSFYISDDGKDMTYCFRFPNTMMAAYSSFISDCLSRENMQAITDAELLVLKKEAVDKMVQDNLNWTKFLKTIAEQEYLELENRFFQLQRDTAAQRYATLLNNHPDYVKNIPLQYLASYLGITQRHLSRIRKEISF
ncbi:Crp/Fnr family transcriptional regulator [Chryseobacterium lactis]|uniref:Crp/Fnr family transcriptional regulator n=1 Tax=Chryseobacterium lactis TaxID=1241981 RepID=A0A3G6RL71_CHRLC|nr:Crp/Fnr family transcriptional regulator [Chryseobacterium lactis]AZA84630.1 Crp/Fnr family transcriptional regulator [Chryseobacterium lactis]AZB05018.1 Crp/Fnr family transcriptional regulator [Chryseobacterium lactis]PNW14749.1 Crp/Fnr family transcriptional regulator [Chryseobacterium lactis]